MKVIIEANNMDAGTNTNNKIEYIESMSMDGLIGIELGIYSSYQQADMVMGEIRSHILAGYNYYKMPDDIGNVDYDEE